MRKLPHILERNRDWAQSVANSDPKFFERLSAIQRPQYLWIGCADSRVPANQITGLLPGEVFVHRNVGNIVGSTDLNVLSVLQYAVEVLGVEHIIVCGHYGCGAVQATYNSQRFGLIDYWLSSIRQIKEKYKHELDRCGDSARGVDRLCELNVYEQAHSLCATDIVQDAWKRGKGLTVHGWIYKLSDGRLRDLGFCVSSPAEFGDTKAPPAQG
jgi:carbonic anhydrase